MSIKLGLEIPNKNMRNWALLKCSNNSNMRKTG
jgi:hypothetical protein